eukprot:Blabericola_migrator_1__12949@NODE_856_length_6242_cov_79_686478_g606_i0_p2_GENE_NODE_856_length_6242_cov_79_686478_g606_i0NODE_856_length_6242_cov_79_686478_g606_i0_p2_ORF_typecomplete_len150_score5_42NOGCT/PF08155_11/0_29_NODE_856_length_6242_cov_79_686478_g606_i046605109
MAHIRTLPSSITMPPRLLCLMCNHPKGPTETNKSPPLARTPDPIDKREPWYISFTSPQEIWWVCLNHTGIVQVYSFDLRDKWIIQDVHDLASAIQCDDNGDPSVDAEPIRVQKAPSSHQTERPPLFSRSPHQSYSNSVLKHSARRVCLT